MNRTIITFAIVDGAVRCRQIGDDQSQCNNDSSIYVTSEQHVMAAEPRCANHAHVIFSEFIAEVAG